MQSDNYWSGSEYDAWNFNTGNGNQNNDDKNNPLFAVAVRFREAPLPFLGLIKQA